MVSGLIKIGLVFCAFIALMVIAVVVFATSLPEEKNYDEFAQCLTEKGVKMYGAYWCGHCNAQKEAFGGSWQYVDYVECATSGSGQAEECLEAGINAYPTWVLPDGTQAVGEQSFERLSELSGCELAKTSG